VELMILVAGFTGDAGVMNAGGQITIVQQVYTALTR
jgi:hypothetical protein